MEYNQYETRSADETKTNWMTQLPGSGSHIKRDDLVNAQATVAQAYAAPAYKAPAYKPAY